MRKLVLALAAMAAVTFVAPVASYVTPAKADTVIVHRHHHHYYDYGPRYRDKTVIIKHHDY
jgi:hypothetical protein